MKSYRLITLATVIFAFIIFSEQPSFSARKEKPPRVEFVKKESANKVEIRIGGKLITSYCWPENVYKPILYPVYTINGTEITRGFPLKPRAGERNDHIHQVGIWLNYGNVNGYDFWGNGSEGKKSENGGVIKHLRIENAKGGPGEGIMTVAASWQDPSGKELIAERTEFHFIARGTSYIIDRLTTLTATGNAITMKDTKEGMYAIRVARQLELPSEEDVRLLDQAGNPGAEIAKDNIGVTGNYRSSEGITGDEVWSTRARWMDLSGSINNEKISIVICDHPKNVSYPTYWHARGYGLFSANPLGGNDFTKGKEVVNFSIPSGKSVIFRYRIIVNSGSSLTSDDINLLADEFAAMY
jgi:hypothetical protein